MLKTGRFFQADGQPVQPAPNPTPAKKSHLPAFLRKKPQEQQPVMVVATIK
jgi:hypothetical protein